MTCLAAFALQAPAAPQGGSVTSLIWMFLLLGIFWVIMILPQRKQQKKRMEMLNALKKGDKIVTIGGIHGEITELGEEDIRLRIADKVEIKLTKGSVSRVKGE
ncbi:MAG TPA: preprotein translocase subunit YajC [Firmicutes bacterium]|jgi:preprotein translocase subunit YajC|nr:preprotein translocase subunit YajC [Bacillota bacterium]